MRLSLTRLEQADEDQLFSKMWHNYTLSPTVLSTRASFLLRVSTPFATKISLSGTFRVPQPKKIATKSTNKELFQQTLMNIQELNSRHQSVLTATLSQRKPYERSQAVQSREQVITKRDLAQRSSISVQSDFFDQTFSVSTRRIKPVETAQLQTPQS